MPTSEFLEPAIDELVMLYVSRWEEGRVPATDDPAAIAEAAVARLIAGGRLLWDIDRTSSDREPRAILRVYAPESEWFK